MPEQQTPFHYVCTIEKARELVQEREQFWVTDCGCRAKDNACKRSRIDVCLHFVGTSHQPEVILKPITRADVDSILQEAYEKFLISRPFRNETDRTLTEGICFCCDDCCAYFTGFDEVCDKGDLIEKTAMDTCTHCGKCEPVCYFGARTMNDGTLSVQRDSCYGCGLCVRSCPEDCIEMVNRR